MSDQTRLINEKIKMRSARRDLNKNNKKTNDTILITETSPAGIAGKQQTENNTWSIDVNELKKIDFSKEPLKIVTNVDIPKKSFNTMTSLYPSYVRFYSLIPNDEEIRIVSRDKEMCNGLKCNTPTEYKNIEPGIYDMYFYNNSNTLLYKYKLKAFNCAINTLIITKANNGYSVFVLKGTTMDCIYNTSYVRFIQTVPLTPALDIYIDGIPVILGIMYNEISDFIGMPSGIHNITVVAAATSRIYIDKSFNFSSKSLNDLFIVSENPGVYNFSLLANEDTCI